VDFETPEEACRAIREKDHKVFSDKFGDRYVRLIQVSMSGVRPVVLSVLVHPLFGERSTCWCRQKYVQRYAGF